jgi:hypothetical protein
LLSKHLYCSHHPVDERNGPFSTFGDSRWHHWRMEIPIVISRVSFLWAKSLGPWLSVWAIRYKTDCDFKLSPTVRTVRWLVVTVGYFLAASLPGPGIVRLVPGLTGLCFLCWPNLAYHFTNFFVRWPKTEGRVTVLFVFGIVSGPQLFIRIRRQHLRR